MATPNTNSAAIVINISASAAVIVIAALTSLSALSVVWRYGSVVSTTTVAGSCSQSPRQDEPAAVVVGNHTGNTAVGRLAEARRLFSYSWQLQIPTLPRS